MLTVEFQSKDRIYGVSDRLLFANDRILAAKIVYVIKIVIHTMVYFISYDRKPNRLLSGVRWSMKIASKSNCLSKTFIFHLWTIDDVIMISKE